jgi:hypothetical protein
MHRSRLCAALVDVPPEMYETEVAFWVGAVGAGEPTYDAGNPDDADLGNPIPRMQFMVQRIGGPARVHLDIETDRGAAGEDVGGDARSGGAAVLRRASAVRRLPGRRQRVAVT